MFFKRIAITSLVVASLFATAAQAANTALSALSASGAIAGANLFYVVQTAGSGGVKATATQLATYFEGLISGDCTINTSTNVITCTKTNGTAFGALATITPGTGIATALGVNVGSAGAPVLNGGALGTPSSGTLTNTTGLPISTGVSGLASGIAAWLATPSSANLLAALTISTGTGSAVFGTAPTISSLNASVAMTLAFITGSTQCLQVNTSGVVSGTGAVCGGSGSSGANPTATAGPTAVNGSATTFMRSDGAPAVQLGTGSAPGLVQCGLGLTCTAGVAGSQVTQRNNTTTTDTLIASDAGTVVTESNASAVAVGIAVASTTGFTSGNYWTLKNKGAGLVTLTPTTSTIDGAATLTLAQNQSVDFYSDGTNYLTLRGPGTATIASGTAALGTGAISSATCATVVTATATGTLTTDVVTASFNGDPTAVTGYSPVTTGALTLFTYPTANTFNVKVCNLTSASITPGAITLNWRVVR